MPAVPSPGRVVGIAGKDDLWCVSASVFGHGGNDLPGHPQTAAHVVSGYLVRHQSEERRQRHECTEDLGPGKLYHRLDVVTEASSRNGAT